MKSNKYLRIASIVGLILLIPLLGNIFVEGWNWGVLDFIIIGLMLFLAGIAIDFVGKRLTNPLHRIIALTIIVSVFLLIWVEFAVDAVSETIKLYF